MPEPPDVDEELLRGMWRECADDLRRWAKAFNDRAGLTVDSASYTALERLAVSVAAWIARRILEADR